MISHVENRDCMEFMAEYPDKFFELAIVDPPYGVGDKFKGGKTGKMNFNEVVEKAWDVLPPQDYFVELSRVSINQIVWGGNYFFDKLGPTRCVLIWDKLIPFDFSLASVEIAWTSFDRLAKQLRLRNLSDRRIHPTQKPVALYKWLLTNYAKPGDKILDTHLGSGSSRIAAHDLGFDFYATELDKDYFDAQEKRFQDHIAQGSLFTPEPPEQPTQEALW